MIVGSEEEILASDLGSLSHDPLAFVRYVFPWGEGDLEGCAGPWKWQSEILEEIGVHLQNPQTRHKPFRAAVSSGRGIGKSSLLAWLVIWALSTFEDSKAIITANTNGQLDTKTQPELAKWFRLALNSHWFDVHVQHVKVKEPGHEQTWRADLIPWSEDNPAAFQGAHNLHKRMMVIFDEASEIAHTIWHATQGCFTDVDTEMLWFVFGNPTVPQGDFHDAVFGDQRHRWKTRVIDSRDVEGVNREELAEWMDVYGEDSDYFRVHARGLPPRSAAAQYIDQDLISLAQKRAPRSLPDDPLVAGVDFAWGGVDDNVIRFRKGYDAASIPPIKIKGEFTRDPAIMVGKLNDVLTRTYNGEKVQTLFMDSAGIAAPIEARLKALGRRNIVSVNFGADSPDQHHAYWRDYMWGKMKEWLAEGAIDKDKDLEADLAKPILVSDRLQRVKLESKELMKKRLAKLGIESSSPDDGDALALTFAMPVAPRKAQAATPRPYDPRTQQHQWMG